jgi:hypothetical protein
MTEYRLKYTLIVIESLCRAWLAVVGFVKKIAYPLAMIFIASTITGILAATFIMVYPFEVVRFHDEYLPVAKKQVRPGEVLPITYCFEKFTNVPTIINRAFINGVVYSETRDRTQTQGEV